jgi:NAD(P)-dependent dehydrogenase (short-subunit alcohol dehydrogenase family)
MNGQLAIVTGGSKGIGAAVALLAAKAGFTILVTYATDAAGAQAVVDSIRTGGGHADCVQADVADEGGVSHVFATADAMGVPLASLINNAGITGGFSRVDAIDAKMLQRLLAINVAGSFLCAREAVRRMSTRHGGRGGTIVNNSSIAAKLGSPGEYVHYAATKGAIDSMTVGLAREVGAEGIRVNAVAPGLIETGIHAASGDPGRVARLAPGVPMGRGGTPEEVAEVVVWLMSPAASYVTGAVVPVGGGR